jgi:hypothetical protein
MLVVVEPLGLLVVDALGSALPLATLTFGWVEAAGPVVLLVLLELGLAALFDVSSFACRASNKHL